MNKPRLIDANELVIETKKCLSLCETFRGYTAEDALKHFLLLIDEQPTAYDVTSVVKQLEDHLTGWVPIECIYDAIKIVKGGAE